MTLPIANPASNTIQIALRSNASVRTVLITRKYNTSPSSTKLLMRPNEFCGRSANAAERSSAPMCAIIRISTGVIISGSRFTNKYFISGTPSSKKKLPAISAGSP